MAAVTELPESVAVASIPPEVPVAPGLRRRAVAVTASPMELLRPESDLARLIQGFAHVDLLVAVDDLPVQAPGSVGVLVGVGEPGNLDGRGPEDLRDGVARNDADWDDDWDEDSEDVTVPDEEVGRLALPGLHLHRLGLRPPLDPLVEGDIVAALSELVGFDPEPGVCCLAPSLTDADPDRAVIDLAVQRIVGVYGMPLLRYRCLELSVVAKA